MHKTVFAFIKELDKDCATLQANNQEVKVALDEENRQLLFEAIDQGTYIVPFNTVSQEIVLDISSLHYFPETGRPELKDADFVSVEN